MRVNRIVAAIVAGCAMVVVSAVTALAGHTPQEPHHAATDTVKPVGERLNREPFAT